MNPLDFALRKSETALERVMATLALAVVAMLGLVWLSIAATGWLALVLPAPLAAAITGGVTMTIAAAAFFYIRWIRKQPNAEPIPDKASAANTDDLISRATLIAERMAPDAPLAAMAFASLAGFASVSLPATFNPYLNKILDDVEKFPGNQVKN